MNNRGSVLGEGWRRSRDYRLMMMVCWWWWSDRGDEMKARRKVIEQRRSRSVCAELKCVFSVIKVCWQCECAQRRRRNVRCQTEGAEKRVWAALTGQIVNGEKIVKFSQSQSAQTTTQTDSCCHCVVFVVPTVHTFWSHTHTHMVNLRQKKSGGIDKTIIHKLSDSLKRRRAELKKLLTKNKNKNKKQSQCQLLFDGCAQFEQHRVHISSLLRKSQSPVQFLQSLRGSRNHQQKKILAQIFAALEWRFVAESTVCLCCVFCCFSLSLSVGWSHRQNEEKEKETNEFRWNASTENAEVTDCVQNESEWGRIGKRKREREHSLANWPIAGQWLTDWLNECMNAASKRISKSCTSWAFFSTSSSSAAQHPNERV